MPVWSMGCVLRDLLTHNPGYKDLSLLRAMFLTVTKGASKLAQPLPPTFDAALHFMWQCLRPLDTRPSASELLRDPFVRGGNFEGASRQLATWAAERARTL